MLPSIMHELYLTGFELELWQAVNTRDDLTIKGRPERRYFLKENKLTFAEQGVSHDLIPDAGFLLAQQRDDDQPRLLQHFVEVDRGTESLTTVRKKFETYDAWWHSDEGRRYLIDLYKAHGRPEPQANMRLLVVIRAGKQNQDGRDHGRLLSLYMQSLELPADTRNLLWFTTIDEIKAVEQGDRQPLANAIWWRGQQAHRWIDDYRSFVAALKQGRGQKPHRHKRNYDAEQLRAMPKVAFLPQP